MKNCITLKLLSLALLAAISFPGCGKKGGDAQLPAQSSGLGADLDSITIEDEITDPPVDTDPETPVDPETPTDPENPDNPERHNLLLNTNLRSECYFSRQATDEFGQETYVRSQYNFHENGKGHYTYEAFSDSGCEQFLDRDQFQISYELVKTVDRVWVITIKQGRGYSEKEEQFFWITLLPTKDGMYLDINGQRENSGPYLQEPGQEVVQEFSLDAENLGIGFFKK